MEEKRIEKKQSKKGVMVLIAGLVGAYIVGYFAGYKSHSDKVLNSIKNTSFVMLVEQKK